METMLELHADTSSHNSLSKPHLHVFTQSLHGKNLFLMIDLVKKMSPNTDLLKR